MMWTMSPWGSRSALIKGAEIRFKPRNHLLSDSLAQSSFTKGLKFVMNFRVFPILLFFILCSIGLNCSEPESTAQPDSSRKIQPPVEEESPQWKKPLGKLREKFGLETNQLAIIVDVSEQRLYLVSDTQVVITYPVSTSRYGVGSKVGTNRTPLGTHRIASKKGEGDPIGTIFKARANTGKIAKIYEDTTKLDQDLVTTRLIWLEGLEPGVNKGKGIDSYRRYIYIHGTPEEGLIGQPRSHGCVRMKNQDIIDLFNRVSVGTLVEIQR